MASKSSKVKEQLSDKTNKQHVLGFKRVPQCKICKGPKELLYSITKEILADGSLSAIARKYSAQYPPKGLGPFNIHRHKQHVMSSLDTAVMLGTSPHRGDPEKMLKSLFDLATHDMLENALILHAGYRETIEDICTLDCLLKSLEEDEDSTTLEFRRSLVEIIHQKEELVHKLCSLAASQLGRQDSGGTINIAIFNNGLEDFVQRSADIIRAELPANAQMRVGQKLMRALDECVVRLMPKDQYAAVFPLKQIAGSSSEEANKVRGSRR